MSFDNSICRAAHPGGASPALRRGAGSAFEMTRNSRVSALQRQIWKLQLKYGRKFDLPEDLFACTSGDGETDPENIE